MFVALFLAHCKMKSLKLFTILIFLLNFISSTKAAPNFLSHYCQKTTYDKNSTYRSNLKSLLSSLSSNSSLPNLNGFYNTSTGKSPDEVIYGLFQCTGDVSHDTCQDCVTYATRDIIEYCPNNTVAIIWYDQCLLRYSNQPKTSFSRIDGPIKELVNVNNVSSNEAESFSNLVSTTLTDSSGEAANTPSGYNKFAVKETDTKGNFSEFNKLYTLVQCTQDLSTYECNYCLQEGLSGWKSCCVERQGATFLLPSCYFRYELYPFYNSTGVVTAPPPPGVVSAPLPSQPRSGKSSNSTSTVVAITIAVGASILLVMICTGYCFLSRRARQKKKYAYLEDNATSDISLETIQYDLGTIEAATNNFCPENKLGEGGFGEVYKGTLANGLAIAVKRLSKLSVQGAQEFKNEAILVAKLQHRNLVRLLGFCVEGEEKILVYEFVINKSLDFFLYGRERQGQLDWPRRYKIIGGIARGILYLHEDSQLRIIHRDLKASNILLDGEMNPKISDFGMARIFVVDQTQANTDRIVGTYGYMSPEYAMQGHFSVKSDVYSFGVLVLEIITGKKNNSFSETDDYDSLIGYVWKHWAEGTTLMEVVDPALAGKYLQNEVFRCIQIGLLCVQDDPADRPTMATVVLMLNSYSVTLSLPQKPSLLHSRIIDRGLQWSETDESKSMSVVPSVDDASSITIVYPR